MKKLSKLSLILSTLLLSVCTPDNVVLFGSISGVVRDAQTQQPLENVSVSLKPGGLTKVTGRDGAYSFAELDAKEYTLTYAKPDYITVSKETTVQPRMNNVIEIVLTPEPLIPVLKTNVKSLDFGKELETLSLEITNTGKGSLDWHIEYEPDWFSCSPSAGSTGNEKATVVVTVNRNQKEKGTYRQTFSIASNGGREDITVTMEVAGANLAYEPLELDFGTLTSTLPLTLVNNGSGTIDYTAEASNKWIVLGKSSGKITTTDYIQVMIDRGTLSAGSYSGTVTILSGLERFAVPVKMSIATEEKPLISIQSTSSVTYNSAVFNGLMLSVGSQKVSKFGLCWGTSPRPTVEGAHSDLGDCTNPTAFEGIASNLQPNTQYYVRAYAQNAVGLSYSASDLSFTTLGLPSSDVVSVGSVSLSPTSLSKQVGDPAVALVATVSPANATNKTIIWSSSNTSVATVSNRIVNFVGAGSASITVTTVDGGKTATCNVTVTSPTIRVSGVSLNQNTFTLGVGLTGQLIATVLPVNASNRDVSWKSSRTSVATVSSTGLITAVSPGSATITVTTDDGGKTAACNVTVASAIVPVTGVSLNHNTLSLKTDSAGQLIATVSPSNATNKNINWASSNTSVATVSTAGFVMAVSAGSATITATTADGGKTATCNVTVTSATAPVTGVSLNPTTLTLTPGSTNQLTATVSPSNATNKNINWTSNNTSVATVSATGLVTAVSTGSASITATTADGGKTATCNVTVATSTVPVTGVSLNSTTLSKQVGDPAVSLVATVSPSNATNKSVTWSSSNPSVATVSNGTVSFVGAGSASITVTTVDGGKTATCGVTVTGGTTASLTWEISPDGTLTISGNGAMPDYNYTSNPSPWNSRKDNIKRVVIQNGITSIGVHAFAYHSNLTSITIPTSITSISGWAFTTSGLTSVTIPASVTSIQEGTFDRCYNMASITLPGSLTSIGKWAFAYCSGLKSITIPDKVTSIGIETFLDCNGLTSITIPASVTSIGDGAFSGCTGLTSVTNQAVTPQSINSNVFQGITIRNIPLTVPDASLSSYQTANVWKDFSIANIGGTTGSLTWTFANGTLSISGTGAMPDYGTNNTPWNSVRDNITKVNIQNGVTSIGNSAFHGCGSLSSITIPGSVTSIGGYAFTYSTSLASITIPNSVTNIGEHAFARTGLRAVTIPNSVAHIENGTFTQCGDLTSVIIPNSVTRIGITAFAYSGLTSITIPDWVTHIEQSAFQECHGLTSITIPNSVTSIAGYAFAQTGLTSITIPCSVANIGEAAFASCHQLTSVRAMCATPLSIHSNTFGGVPSSAALIVPQGSEAAYESATGWKEFGTIGVFGTAGSLSWIFIDGALTISGNGPIPSIEVSFTINITNITTLITTLVVQPGVTSIGESAFFNCTALTSVTLPNSVTSIKKGAFWGCGKLSSITIPTSVTSIGQQAFDYCSSLTSITIPASVTSIGIYAFTYCTGLTSVTNLAATPQVIEANVFENITLGNLSLNVPKGSKAAYQSATGWKEFGTIVEMP